MPKAIAPLLQALVSAGGSDLHLRAGAVPSMRVDGVLHRLDSAPIDHEATLALLLETMPERQRARFEDGHDVDYAVEPTAGERFRVNAFRFRGRPAAVLRRVLPAPLRLTSLGLPSVLSSLALRPHGLTLVTGRAGSGKTTTLAAMAEEINVTRPVHILTLEDPIEVLIPEKVAVVTQREIASDVETFGGALRAAMRQDPNVIVVGEMRDEETVRAALVAAETGHHVISTLHTTDAVSSIYRILDLFPPQEQKQIRVTLAAVLNGVICQRLVPRSDGPGRVAATEVAVNTGLDVGGDRRSGEDRHDSRPRRPRRLPRHAQLPPGPGPPARRRGRVLGGRPRRGHRSARPRGGRAPRRPAEPHNVWVNEVPPARAGIHNAAEVKRLRRLRHTLDQVVRELRVWVDLLRNKALALRAVAAVPRESTRPYERELHPLSPGSLDPRTLANALAAQGSPPRQHRRIPAPRLVSDDTDEVLHEAQVLWDTVADPYDAQACRDLADAADRLADKLEDRWRDARDQLRSVSEALNRAATAADADDR